MLICSGQYDEEYLEYLGKLLRSMEKHGLFCYVVSLALLARAQLTAGDAPGRVVQVLWRSEPTVSCASQADP